MHPWPEKIIPVTKKFDYAIISAHGKHGKHPKTVPDRLHNFPLAGAYIGIQYLKTVKPGEEEGERRNGGHAVAGIVCDDGRRALFDSNFGELDIDWVLHPEGVEAHFLKHYGVIYMYTIIALYVSNEFRAKHAAEVPCMSTSKPHVIRVAPSERSSEILCTLAERLSSGPINWDAVNIADGTNVDVRYWRNAP